MMIWPFSLLFLFLIVACSGICFDTMVEPATVKCGHSFWWVSLSVIGSHGCFAQIFGKKFVEFANFHYGVVTLSKLYCCFVQILLLYKRGCLISFAAGIGYSCFRRRLLVPLIRYLHCFLLACAPIHVCRPILKAWLLTFRCAKFSILFTFVLF